MQIPLDTVREVAQILQSQGLGEITLETAGARLTLKRPPSVAPVSLPADSDAAPGNDPDSAQSEATVAASSPLIHVVSPAVGVFREAKTALQIGDEVAKRAVLGAVETLNIPSELVAAQAARVTEILAIEGQRVEWGQALLVLEPLALDLPKISSESS